jgi:hypothetical protein
MPHFLHAEPENFNIGNVVSTNIPACQKTHSLPDERTALRKI